MINFFEIIHNASGISEILRQSQSDGPAPRGAGPSGTQMTLKVKFKFHHIQSRLRSIHDAPILSKCADPSYNPTKVITQASYFLSIMTVFTPK